MSQTNKLPVLRAVSASWQFVLNSWMLLLPAFLVKALISGAFYSMYLTEGESGGFSMLVGLLLFGAEVVCISMALRYSIRGEYNGLLGTQIGKDEGRLFLATMMFSFVMFFVLIASLYLVSMFVVAYASTTVEDMAAIADDEAAMTKVVLEAFSTPSGVVIALILAVIFLAPILYLAARLITYSAATIARRRIMVFETWKWTKGYALQIIIALVLTYIPVYLINLLGSQALMAVLGFNLFSEGQTISRLSAFIFGIGSGLLSIPVILVGAGLSAFMYQGFDPDPSKIEN